MNIVQIVTLFLEGVLSFFSPCVLPILPVYVGILAGNGDGNSQKTQYKVVVNTLFFVAGISLSSPV
ncbi:cytochrome c biogenesis CcdA family protein [Streptococcus sp. S784/96/1]|uniref:cytochrome c biogenesis CcdA family protein n=1 Tax=Streptococcus sp. S784/96/1 TaxID=2653499 RepID=UPI0023686329|nr:cytochrome c biogenesis protein CcdA [Streptococcus sp. S784/96/1]